MTGTTTMTLTEPGTGTEILKIVAERPGKVRLTLKTCKEFEQWLQATETLTTTENFLGVGIRKSYYKSHRNPSTYDDINGKLIYNGCFNSAILRLKGISEGVEVESTELISKQELQLLTKKLKATFGEFYFEYVRPVKIVSTLYAEGI